MADDYRDDRYRQPRDRYRDEDYYRRHGAGERPRGRDVDRDRDWRDESRRAAPDEHYGYYGGGEWRRADYTQSEPGGYGDRDYDEGRYGRDRPYHGRPPPGFDEADRGHRGRGPSGYKRSDARISEDVHDRLTEDHYLDATDIQVRVEDGEVTLEGHVANRRDKRRAEDLADDVPGVRHVQNNLRVSAAGFAMTGAAARQQEQRGAGWGRSDTTGTVRTDRTDDRAGDRREAASGQGYGTTGFGTERGGDNTTDTGLTGTPTSGSGRAIP